MSTRIVSRWLVVLVSVGLVLMALATACQKPASREHFATGDDGHGLHMLNNERLRLLMDELRGLDFEKVSGDLATGRQDNGHIRKVAVAASALAADAQMIPLTYKNMDMSEESRRVFDHFSAQLREQCRELESMARKNDTTKIKGQLDRVISTCNACHANFRGPRMAMLRDDDTPH
ncbi:MAG: cytochrome c [Planctomycetota bacterium]